MLFDVAKQIEHGTPNAIVARLTVQPTELLNQTTMVEADQSTFVKLSVGELAPRLLRCFEIEQRLRKEANERRPKFKRPSRGDVAVEIPQIPNLKADCENFLYEAKNYLRDLLKLVNLLWGTKYEDASEWVKGKKGRPSVQQFIIEQFGDSHANGKFIQQCQACIEPFSLMRDGVEHPESSKLDIQNFTRAEDKLIEPTWSLEKGGKYQVEPVPIIEDMARALDNLLILAEDMLIMWAQVNLAAPQLTEVRVIPALQRKSECPVKYRMWPTDAVLRDIARREAAKMSAR
jgi:hypothetical protein